MSLILLTTFLSVDKVYSQTLIPGQIDYSGVSEFWKIHNLLLKDSEPTDAQWKTLFETACYQYISQSDSKDKIKKRFRIAFKPSLKENRKKTLAKNNYESRIINHLLYVSKNESKIKDYTKKLQSQDILSESLKFTKTYLPKKFVSKNADLHPPIAFGIFEPDGKANNKIIAIDIAFAQTIDFKKFLAHEAHHFFMGKIRRKMRKAEGEKHYILMSIRQLHFEGIADLIDKKQILSLPDTLKESENWYAYHYKKHYNNARNTFSKIDKLIAEYADSNQSNNNGKKVWKSLHFGTHPEALHMALLIEETFGRKKVLQILSNPFDFFRFYRKAAQKNPNKGWIFSKKTMQYLEKLEKQYLLKT